MRVLLLSAYAAGSHVHWQSRLQAMFADWSWQVLTLPPRNFSWRVRGNPLYWALTQREILRENYDLVIATSMVDLSTLRGLVPALAQHPTVVYFHENQFAYPENTAANANLAQRKNSSQNDRAGQILGVQMLSLYSALAADKIAFNSSYNLNSFTAGCSALLKKLPDFVPPNIVEGIAAKSSIVPVSIEDHSTGSQKVAWPGKVESTILRIVWVGRFEFDKGPEGLLQIVSMLEKSDVEYELAIIGQRFRKSPEAFTILETDYAHRVVHCGYIESHDEYIATLHSADVVLSTALHEFQGLAVLEAVRCGAVPVVPDRLAYPEIFSAEYRYTSTPDDVAMEARAAVEKLLQWHTTKQTFGLNAPDVSLYCDDALRNSYKLLFDTAIAQHDGS